MNPISKIKTINGAWQTVCGILLFVFCLSPFAFTSCTAPIDIRTDNSQPVIVINGVLTDELKQQEIRLSGSSPYFENQPNVAVSGAIVTIESSTGEIFHLIENDTVSGLYQTAAAWAAVSGRTYRLDISVDFDKDGKKETYEAETTVLAPAPIDSTQIVPMVIMGYNDYALNMYAQEPLGQDYYMIRFFVNDTLVTKKISRYVTFDDVALNGEYINGLTVQYFGDIKNRETDSEDQRKRSDYLTGGDTVRTQMGHIPKGYYDFITQCQQEMNGENPMFGGPPSNIATNISNGGVGYFVGYCITSSTAIVPSTFKDQKEK